MAMSRTSLVVVTLVLFCASYAHASSSKEAYHDDQRQQVYDALYDAIDAADSASKSLVHLSKQPKFRSNEIESLQSCATLVDQSKEQLDQAVDESNRLFQGDGKDQTRKDEISLAASTASTVYRTCETNLRDVRARQVVINRVERAMMPFVHSSLTAMNVVNSIKV